MEEPTIVPQTIQTLGSVYLAAMLEEMRAFDVADRLVELSQTGILPVSRPDAGERLSKLWKGASSAVPRPRRSRVFAEALGLPGGDSTAVRHNREFSDLWLRFLSSVAALARRVTTGDPAVQPPLAASQEQVRKAARDLATNLSLHGHGAAGFAARELQPQVESLITALSDPEIRRAYGARDVTQLVERVVELELGGSPKRGDRLARGKSGAVVLAWLARRSLALGGEGNVLDPAAIKHRVRGDDPATMPTDFDLVSACELWLADAAVSDSDIDTRSRPAQTPEVRDAVRVLLSRSAAFARLAAAMQSRVSRDTTAIAADLAVGFKELIESVDFPQFVTALVTGVFDAIVDASIQQMEAYADLVAAVAASLDKFRDDNISDESARDYLREASPLLSDPPTREEEQRLAKAIDAIAGGRWRRLAKKRQPLVATMVLLGINRCMGVTSRLT
jgi:hypothetical protein